MNTLTISVPRDNPTNTGVCKAVEDLVLTIIADAPEDTFHIKDLTKMANRRLSRTFGELAYHVVRAVDQFLANNLIKRVAPSTYQSVDGPDEVYSERASGHVPEGAPYEPRPKNYNNNSTVPSARRRAIFNAEVRKVESSVSILQRNNKMTVEQIQTALLNSGNFDPVAVKCCMKRIQSDTTETVKA